MVHGQQGNMSQRYQSLLTLISTSTKGGFELFHSTIGKLLALEGPTSINDNHVIFALNNTPGTHSFQNINFFLGRFLVLIDKWSIHGLMSIWIILFACFGSAFKKKGWNEVTKISLKDPLYLQSLAAKVMNLERGLARRSFQRLQHCLLFSFYRRFWWCK